ncbi:MAG: DCC1-like thiol-disulfide oxidoreductase family protein [bacterium]
MRAFITKAAKWLSEEHWLIGASITRISLGIWAVYFLILHWPVRHEIFGPEGVWPFEKFLEDAFLNVFQLSPSPIYFEAIYHLAIAVAVAYALGFWSRLMGVLQWGMIWSLQDRNPFIGDGGDNIMRIVLLFLILANTGAYFSVDAARRARSSRSPLQRILTPVGPFLGPSLAAVHNVGVCLIVAQLCLLYSSTGLYKVMGELWQNGTALYYILRVDDYSWPGVAELLYRNPYLVVAGTYGTVLFELLFTPSLLRPWTRYLAILAGFSFHVGIALFMGLIGFGWSMVSYYPLLVTDREYWSAVAWIRDRISLKVFYDGWCPLCTSSIKWLGRLDLLSLIDFISFRDRGVAEQYGLDVSRAERRIQSVDTSGKIREGMDVLLQIGLRATALWPVLPLLLLGRLVVGQRGYDALASRRLILVPGACAQHCELSIASTEV